MCGQLRSLIPFLDDVEPDMRCAAAVALGDLRAAHSVDPLIAALNDPESICPVRRRLLLWVKSGLDEPLDRLMSYQGRLTASGCVAM